MRTAREDRVSGLVPQPAYVSVVVASHGRPLRLRWLLNALEEQTLPPERWEAVVVHDYAPPTARRVIEAHPLFGQRLRALPISEGAGSPARQRNLGWRAARHRWIAFTDDDCRPEPTWLEELLLAAGQAGDAVVQGATRPDPLESAILAAPHVRTMSIDPVGPYAQTCNILYPRPLIEQLGGFDEGAITGEDVDLALRARAAGVPIVAAPGAVVNHAVEAHSLPGIVVQNLKWRHLAYLVRRHPELRRQLPLGVFWDLEHLWTSLALAGLLAARRRPALLILAVPYVVRVSGRRGEGWRARATSVAELPGQASRQAAEVLGLIWGSLRHRTLVL